MRLSILASVVAGGLALAGANAAAGAPASMASLAIPTVQGNDPFGPGRIEYPTAHQRYAGELSILRKKLVRITADDGGRLSEAHKAALQQELDAINREYAANLPPPRGTLRR
jgi:hypothetical protein